MKRTALALTLVMTLVFSFLFCGILVQPVKSKFIASVFIAEDGSVVGTNSIQRNGNIYTLTGNISGSIQVQKSYIIIDGAGYTVNGRREGVGIDLSNGRGQEPSRTQINNVTVKNLQIINWSYGICNENTNNNTFIGNYIADCNGTGFSIMGSHNNTFIYNTFEDCASGITITYVSSGNVITENNVINVGFLVLIWGAPKPVVDRN